MLKINCSYHVYSFNNHYFQFIKFVPRPVNNKKKKCSLGNSDCQESTKF